MIPGPKQRQAPLAHLLGVLRQAAYAILAERSSVTPEMALRQRPGILTAAANPV
jgi:plasmid maintenance system antidote protein VapI